MSRRIDIESDRSPPPDVVPRTTKSEEPQKDNKNPFAVVSRVSERRGESSTVQIRIKPEGSDPQIDLHWDLRSDHPASEDRDLRVRVQQSSRESVLEITRTRKVMERSPSRRSGEPLRLTPVPTHETDKDDDSSSMGRVRQFRRFLGADEFSWSGSLWRALPAEFLGTGFLVLVGCGSCTTWSEKEADRKGDVQIALCFGIAVAVMVQAICHISGGHINPAVTAGMLVAGRCSLLRALLYVVMQCTGAIAGAAILKAVTPDGLTAILGLTTVNEKLTDAQALGVEFLVTFVLVATVFAVTDENRLDLKGSGPIAIGLSIITCHLWAIKYTGSSMNSARSFGPAVIMNSWEKHWIYWVGPVMGGVVAGLLYTYLFAANPPDKEELERARLQALQPYTDKDSDRTTSI